MEEYITYEQARAMIGEGTSEGALGKFLGRHRIRRYVRREDVERALRDAPGRGRWGARPGQ